MPTWKLNNKLENSYKKCRSCTIGTDDAVSYRVLLFKLLEMIMNYLIKCVVTLADLWSGSVNTTARKKGIITV